MTKSRLVERKIEYFKITADGGDNGLFGEKLLTINDELSEQEREYTFNNTSINLEIIKSDLNDEYVRGIISQIRNVAPSKRKRGHHERKPVELEEDEGIDEHTHFIYCPVTSLVCIEYNYHGPKIGLLTTIVNRLCSTIEKKAKRNGFKYVQSGSAVSKVLHKKKVKSVVAQLVDPKTTGNLNDEPDLPEVFESFKAPKDTVIEVKMKSNTRGVAAMTIESFKRMFLREESDLEYYDKIKVTVDDDETGKAIEYDLIKDKKQDIVTVDLVLGTKEIDTNVLISKMEDKISLFKDNTYV